MPGTAEMAVCPVDHLGQQLQGLIELVHPTVQSGSRRLQPVWVIQLASSPLACAPAAKPSAVPHTGDLTPPSRQTLLVGHVDLGLKAD